MTLTPDEFNEIMTNIQDWTAVYDNDIAELLAPDDVLILIKKAKEEYEKVYKLAFPSESQT
jgi:hypothetical protein